MPRGFIIKIRRNSDNWGPISFDLTGGIPEGAIIQDVEVQSFLEQQGEEDTPSTAQLIDGAPQVVHPVIQLSLQYPGDDLIGNHRLELLVSFGGSRSHLFDFRYVVVRK